MRLFRYRRRQSLLPTAQQTSLVRILRTPDDVADAWRRVAEFEEKLAAQAACRAERYRTYWEIHRSQREIEESERSRDSSVS